eukprot:356771-Chlamydomonas_euryale.AAC.3
MRAGRRGERGLVHVHKCFASSGKARCRAGGHGNAMDKRGNALGCVGDGIPPLLRKAVAESPSLRKAMVESPRSVPSAWAINVNLTSGHAAAAWRPCGRRLFLLCCAGDKCGRRLFLLCCAGDKCDSRTQEGVDLRLSPLPTTLLLRNGRPAAVPVCGPPGVAVAAPDVARDAGHGNAWQQGGPPCAELLHDEPLKPEAAEAHAAERARPAPHVQKWRAIHMHCLCPQHGFFPSAWQGNALDHTFNPSTHMLTTSWLLLLACSQHQMPTWTTLTPLFEEDVLFALDAGGLQQ